MIPLVIPNKLSPSIIEFAKRLDSTSSPIRVRVDTDPKARDLDCYENVDQYIKQHGGTKQHGWSVAELKGAFLEAEFHAVWVSPSGEYADINPQQIKTDYIMFIPDSQRVYDGHQVFNSFYQLGDSATVTDYIDSAKKVYEYMNEEEKAYDVGYVRVDENLKTLLLARQMALMLVLQEVKH